MAQRLALQAAFACVGLSVLQGAWGDEDGSKGSCIAAVPPPDNGDEVRLLQTVGGSSEHSLSRAKRALDLGLGTEQVPEWVKCANTYPSHQEAIRNDDVENQVVYSKTGDDIPEVFHGLFWMDQTGYYQTRQDRPNQTGYYETLPGQNQYFKSLPHNLHGSAPEILAGFGANLWDNVTRCVDMVPRIDYWTYANTTGTSAGSLEWSKMENLTVHFCLDDEAGIVTHMSSACTDGYRPRNKAYYQDVGRRMIPKPWGFERLNTAEQMTKDNGQISAAEHYGVYRIVDGSGRRTEHYQAYLDFMKTKCWYTQAVRTGVNPHSDDPSCTSSGGFLVNLGGDTHIIGRSGP